MSSRAKRMIKYDNQLINFLRLSPSNYGYKLYFVISRLLAKTLVCPYLTVVSPKS